MDTMNATAKKLINTGAPLKDTSYGILKWTKKIHGITLLMMMIIIVMLAQTKTYSRQNVRWQSIWKVGCIRGTNCYKADTMLKYFLNKISLHWEKYGSGGNKRYPNIVTEKIWRVLEKRDDYTPLVDVNVKKVSICAIKTVVNIWQGWQPISWFIFI